MSTTLEETEVTRRPRGERPQRQVTTRDRVEIETADTTSPQDALDDSARRQRESDSRLATERAARIRAEQAAATATAEAQRGRLEDRQVVLGSLIESTQAEIEGAEAAYRAARSEGNVDDELKAQRTIASATSRQTQAEAELEHLKARAKDPAPTTRTDPTEIRQQVSERAQKWIDDHPQFTSNDQFREDALAGHNAAIRAGNTVDSDGYYQHLNSRMARLYPEAFQDMSDITQRRPEPPRGGGGAPPSRGAPNNSGYRDAVTPLGTVRYQDRSDGSRSVRMDATTRENMLEGARVTFRDYDQASPEKQAEMLGEYVNDHIAAHDEGYEDLKSGDGKGWR